MGLVTTEVQGLEPLIAKLPDMTSDARIRKVGLKAIEPGAKIMKAAIQAEAPVAKQDTKGKYAHTKGALKRGVSYKASRTKNVEYWGGTPAISAYVVGPFGKGTSQRHLIVSGHKTTGHFSTANHNRQTGAHFATGGKDRTDANPFVQRGVDRSQADAFSAIESTASEALEILANG
jgi:hypothetical protein